MSDAWSAFRAGYTEVRFFLQRGNKALILPSPGKAMSEQQMYIRAAIVLLAAHVEGFFASMSDEYADQLNGQWDTLPIGMKRALVHFAETRLKRVSKKSNGKGSYADIIKAELVVLATMLDRIANSSDEQMTPTMRALLVSAGRSALRDGGGE